jgi:hypothetical protein
VRRRDKILTELSGALLRFVTCVAHKSRAKEYDGGDSDPDCLQKTPDEPVIVACTIARGRGSIVVAAIGNKDTQCVNNIRHGHATLLSSWRCDNGPFYVLPVCCLYENSKEFRQQIIVLCCEQI